LKRLKKGLFRVKTKRKEINNKMHLIKLIKIANVIFFIVFLKLLKNPVSFFAISQ